MELVQKLVAAASLSLAVVASPIAASATTAGQAVNHVRALYVEHAISLLRYNMPLWYTDERERFFSDNINAMFDQKRFPFPLDPFFNADGDVIEDLLLTPVASSSMEASAPDVLARFTVGGERVALRYVLESDQQNRPQIVDILGPDWSLSEFLEVRAPNASPAIERQFREAGPPPVYR